MDYSNSSTQQDEKGSFLIVFLFGVIGGWLELFTTPISDQMIVFLIHLAQSVVFGAAGYLGKKGIDLLSARFSKNKQKNENQ